MASMREYFNRVASIQGEPWAEEVPALHHFVPGKVSSLECLRHQEKVLSVSGVDPSAVDKVLFLLLFYSVLCVDAHIFSAAADISPQHPAVF